MLPARPRRPTHSTSKARAIRRSRLLILSTLLFATRAARAGQLLHLGCAQPVGCRRTRTTTRLISTLLIPALRPPEPDSVLVLPDQRICPVQFNAMQRCWA